MKKLMMTVVALGCAAAVTAQVYSANIVGYNKNAADAGLQIVAMQFDDGVGNTLDSIFGDAYPLGTKILTYEEPGGYKTSTYQVTYPPPNYLPVNGWAGSVSTVGGAVACWIQMPTGEPTVNNIMSGEVDLADSITNSVLAGLNLFSYPYPVEVEVQDLGFTPVLGDRLFAYDNVGGYITVTFQTTYPPPNYLPVDAWSNPTLKIPVGGGFWYSTTTPSTWIADRPFTP